MSIDFNNLTAERVSSEAPHTGGKSRKYDVNPFAKAFAESHLTGEGRAYTLPKSAVKEAVYLLRQAAADSEMGVRIAFSDMKGNVIETSKIKDLPENAKVKVVFWATKKRKYTRKPVESTPAPDQNTTPNK